MQDRVFSNILGRIQVVFAAEDNDLVDMYTGIQVPKDGKPKDNIMHISTYVQATIGEMMQRSRWSSYDFKSGKVNHKLNLDAGLYYPEFVELYENNPEFAKYFSPIIKGVQEMMQPDKNAFHSVRVGLLQGALVDLVEFLDPPPKCTIVPAYRRQRLWMPPGVYDTPMPATLAKIYAQSADVRDGEHPKQRHKKDLVDVFVSGPTGNGSQVNVVHGNNVGDCPYSHRVLLTLEEKNINYNLITVDRKMRPYWYYIVHPEGKVPVISHNGELIEESSYIVDYLENKFGHAKPLSKRLDHVALDPNPIIDGVRSQFMKFVASESARPALLKSLDALEKTVQSYVVTSRGPFFGGKRLSEEDVTLIPYLYHLEVVGGEIRNFKLSPQRYPSVAAYMTAMKQYPAFQNTKALPEHIMYGYKEIERGILHNNRRRVSDILD